MRLSHIHLSERGAFSLSASSTPGNGRLKDPGQPLGVIIPHLRASISSLQDLKLDSSYMGKRLEQQPMYPHYTYYYPHYLQTKVGYPSNSKERNVFVCCKYTSVFSLWNSLKTHLTTLLSINTLSFLSAAYLTLLPNQHGHECLIYISTVSCSSIYGPGPKKGSHRSISKE